MNHERLAGLIRNEAAKAGQPIDTRASERVAERMLSDRDRGAPPPTHVIADRRRRDESGE